MVYGGAVSFCDRCMLGNFPGFSSPQETQVKAILFARSCKIQVELQFPKDSPSVYQEWLLRPRITDGQFFSAARGDRLYGIAIIRRHFLKKSGTGSAEPKAGNKPKNSLKKKYFYDLSKILPFR